jgi:hypothetical protein
MKAIAPGLRDSCEGLSQDARCAQRVCLKRRHMRVSAVHLALRRDEATLTFKCGKSFLVAFFIHLPLSLADVVSMHPKPAYSQGSKRDRRCYASFGFHAGAS